MSKYKIVLDANVVISAALFRKSIVRRAFDKAIAEGQVVLSEPVLEELIDVFSREKFDKYLPSDLRMEFLHDFQTLAETIDIKESVSVCRDPKDDKFLDLALNSQASIIVSGDKDLLVLNPFRGIKILSPASYV